MFLCKNEDFSAIKTQWMKIELLVSVLFIALCSYILMWHISRLFPFKRVKGIPEMNYSICLHGAFSLNMAVHMYYCIFQLWPVHNSILMVLSLARVQKIPWSKCGIWRKESTSQTSLDIKDLLQVLLSLKMVRIILITAFYMMMMTTVDQ